MMGQVCVCVCVSSNTPQTILCKPVHIYQLVPLVYCIHVWFYCVFPVFKIKAYKRSSQGRVWGFLAFIDEEDLSVDSVPGRCISLVARELTSTPTKAGSRHIFYLFDVAPLIT